MMKMEGDDDVAVAGWVDGSRGDGGWPGMDLGGSQRGRRVGGWLAAGTRLMGQAS